MAMPPPPRAPLDLRMADRPVVTCDRSMGCQWKRKASAPEKKGRNPTELRPLTFIPVCLLINKPALTSPVYACCVAAHSQLPPAKSFHKLPGYLKAPAALLRRAASGRQVCLLRTAFQAVAANPQKNQLLHRDYCVVTDPWPVISGLQPAKYYSFDCHSSNSLL